MRLHDLHPATGSKKRPKRLGRGPGSGQGKTAGKGHKGQNCRSGGGVRLGFEGGQMPIHRRLPKRGFKNPFRKIFAVINVQDIAEFESGSVVDEKALVALGLVKGKRDGVKLLGEGDISVPLTVKLDRISQSAKVKIEKAGGAYQPITRSAESEE